MGAKVKKGLLIDTNIVFGYLNGDLQIKLELLRFSTDELHASVVTFAESICTRSKKQQDDVTRFFSKIQVLPIDEQITSRFKGLILAHSPRSRWIPDALIAATALEQGLSLYTLNKKDFDFIPELKLHSPRLRKA